MKALKPKSKRTPETVAVSFRLPAELHAQFERLLGQIGLTWSEGIRQLIQEYTEKYGK